MLNNLALSLIFFCCPTMRIAYYLGLPEPIIRNYSILNSYKKC